MKRLCLLFLITTAVFFLLASCKPMFVRDGGTVVMYGYGYDDAIPPLVSIQNDYLRLDFDTATAEISVTERAAGKVWRSTAELTEEEITKSNAITRFHMQSLFVLDLEDRHGSGLSYDAYRYAIRLEHFEHEIISDRKIELRFTVGDLPDVYYIPEAITAERLEALTGQMDRRNLMLIMNAYRKISHSGLRQSDIESGILERYPMLVPEAGEEELAIYIMVDNLQAQVRERVQDTLQEFGYTAEEYYYDLEFFGESREDNRPAFNVILVIELVNNEMVVTVPLERLNYNPAYLPIRLTLLPFFGAGHETDEGYLFVPDGSGALMYFDSARHNQGLYYSNVYGWDEAVLRTELIHDNRSPYPVFGIHNNGGTFAAIIEEGASYASIRAEVAGMGGPYTRVHPSFRLMHGSMLDVAGRSDRAILMHQYDVQRNENIRIRYIFTEKSGYVGMAAEYRGFLQEKYPWLNERLGKPVSAMAEIIGAALTSQHFLGFPIERPYALTTFAQAADMMDRFHKYGWANIPIKMVGAHNRSIDHSVPANFNLISQLGGKKAFEQMLDTAAENGYDFYIEGDFMFMRKDKWFDGFGRDDVVRQVIRKRLEHNGIGHTFFGEYAEWSLMADPVKLATPSFTRNLVRNFAEQAAGRGVNNIAFRSMASALAGDFHEENFVSREASMNMRIDLLGELRDKGTGIWLEYGFAYAIPFADVVTGMPVSDQGFNITDASIPFYQIALHGLVSFAGRPLNLAEDYSLHLLKSVESGSALFFSFMNAPTEEIKVARYRRYFSNEFGRWADIANRYYQRHAADLGHVYNQLIIDHRFLDAHVTVTVYEDGTRVYVNTGEANFTTADGVEIAKKRYVVQRG